MRPVPYILFRYHLYDEADGPVSPIEDRDVIQSVRGKAAPYRTSDPNPDNYNNYVMRVRPENIEGELVLIFDVGYRISRRVEHRWNRRKDEYDLVDVEADDTVFTRLVAIPRLRVIGAKDGTGDRLAATSAMGRLKAIVNTHSDYSFQYERTASQEDVEAAIARLRLTEFAFEVRPFNPHPSNPGEKLDELLKVAHVQRFRGKAQASPAARMNADEDGLISEAIGLSKAGYGQFAVKGETESGVVVSYAKPTFSPERDRNEAAAGRARALKVAVPRDDPEMTEEEYVVRVILELFGGR